MKLNKKVLISLRKPDTSDGISKRTIKIRRIEVVSCEKGHKVKIHRRRNGHEQYYCETCNSYCTVNETPLSDPSYFDGFITDYIASILKDQKPKVVELCGEHSISRATLYRHLFNKDRKQELAAIVKLCVWLKEALGSLYDRKINGGKLIIKDSREQIELMLIPKTIVGERHSFALDGVFSHPIKGAISPGMLFDTDRKCFKIRSLDLTKSIRDQLFSLETILRSYA